MSHNLETQAYRAKEGIGSQEQRGNEKGEERDPSDPGTRVDAPAVRRRIRHTR